MRRLFWLVAAVVLVDTAFFAAIAPLLPHYSDELGLSKSASGVLVASYAAGTLLGSIPAALLAARAGAKPTLLVGLSTLVLSSIAFGTGGDIVVLDCARFVQGVGGACSWTAGLVWLVAVAPPDRRGELIGSALAAAIVGVMLGPVLGGLATEVGPGAVFGTVAGVALLLAAAAWTTPGAPARADTTLRASVTAFKRPAVLWAFWLFALPSLFAGEIQVLAPLRLDELGASGVAIGGVFLAAAAIEAALSPVTGRVSDRRGRLVPIRAGLAGAAIAAVLLPVPGGVVAFAAVLIAAVAALGMLWAPAMALLSDAAELSGLEQGMAFALANLAWAGGNVVGGAAGGAVADATGDLVPYLLLALVVAATLARVGTRSEVAVAG